MHDASCDIPVCGGTLNACGVRLPQVLFDLVPLRILPPCLLTTVAYPLIGLQHGTWRGPACFTCVVVLANLVSTTQSMAVGALAPNNAVANVVGSLTALLSILMGGFLLSKAHLSPVRGPFSRTAMRKWRIATCGISGGGEMSSRSHFATPADFPRHACSPVPDPNVTIRNFCVAVSHACCLSHLVRSAEGRCEKLHTRRPCAHAQLSFKQQSASVPCSRLKARWCVPARGQVTAVAARFSYVNYAFEALLVNEFKGQHGFAFTSYSKPVVAVNVTGAT
jgi:hypothetical protein